MIVLLKNAGPGQIGQPYRPGQYFPKGKPLYVRCTSGSVLIHTSKTVAQDDFELLTTLSDEESTLLPKEVIRVRASTAKSTPRAKPPSRGKKTTVRAMVTSTAILEAEE